MIGIVLAGCGIAYNGITNTYWGTPLAALGGGTFGWFIVASLTADD